MDEKSIRGLRAARLDRVLDALADRPADGDRPPERPRRRRGPLPLQALRFLSNP
jgi:hypothetical protein